MWLKVVRMLFIVSVYCHVQMKFSNVVLCLAIIQMIVVWDFFLKLVAIRTSVPIVQVCVLAYGCRSLSYGWNSLLLSHDHTSLLPYGRVHLAYIVLPYTFVTVLPYRYVPEVPLHGHPSLSYGWLYGCLYSYLLDRSFL